MGVHPEDVRATHVGGGVESREAMGVGREEEREGCREAKGEKLAGGRAERIAHPSTAGREIGSVTKPRTGQGRQRKKQKEGREDTETQQERREMSSLRAVNREAQPELGPGWKQMWWLWNLTGEGGVAQ